MVQAFALRYLPPLPDPIELLRGAVVTGCALALICASPALLS